MPDETSNGCLNPADGSLWVALSTTPALEAQVQAQRVREALANGANPNLYCREFQNFRSVLGMAVLQQRMETIQALLDAGASVHWPEAELDIAQEELTGEEGDVSYGGHPVDPLGVALEQLAWVLAEAVSDEPCARAQAQTLGEIVNLLIDRGATLRADPATGYAPLDRFLLVLVENPYLFAPWSLPTAATIVFEVLGRIDPETPRKMMAGQWDALAACTWEWHQDLPELAEHLTSLAQQSVMQQSTPPARSTRVARF